MEDFALKTPVIVSTRLLAYLRHDQIYQLWNPIDDIILH